jgi:hypothetical protein
MRNPKFPAVSISPDVIYNNIDGGELVPQPAHERRVGLEDSMDAESARRINDPGSEELARRQRAEAEIRDEEINNLDKLDTLIASASRKLIDGHTK